MRTMGQQEEIVEFARQAFVFLVEDHGFKPPTVTDDRATTQIDFLSDDIAVEVEFDWRDFDAFVFLVRLEGGQLPSGYYVSAAGRKCRKYLQEVFDEREWPLPTALALSQEKPSEARLRNTITAHKDAVLSRIDDLLSLGETLF